MFAQIFSLKASLLQRDNTPEDYADKIEKLVNSFGVEDLDSQAEDEEGGGAESSNRAHTRTVRKRILSDEESADE